MSSRTVSQRSGVTNSLTCILYPQSRLPLLSARPKGPQSRRNDSEQKDHGSCKRAGASAPRNQTESTYPDMFVRAENNPLCHARGEGFQQREAGFCDQDFLG